MSQWLMTERIVLDLPGSSHFPTTIVSTLILLRVNSPMILYMTLNSFLTMSEITCIFTVDAS